MLNQISTPWILDHVCLPDPVRRYLLCLVSKTSREGFVWYPKPVNSKSL